MSVETFTSSTTWTAPAGVTSVDVEAWGTGGSGAQNATNGAGGGAGGGYSKKAAYAVTPGNNYTVTIGAAGGAGTAGGDSWFDSSTTGIMAKGGGGGDASGTGGTGGAAASGVGTTKFSGGDGASIGHPSPVNGGGGSSAGPASDGNPGVGTVGGSAVSGGGAGASAISVSGNAGSPPGGGGSGGRTNGGSGAAGQVVLTYTATGGPVTVSVSDDVAVAENVTPLQVSLVSVTDDVAISDVVKIDDVRIDVPAVVVDTVTTADVVTVAMTRFANVNDAVTAADVSTVASSGFMTVNDTVTTADVPTVILVDLPNVNDTVGVVDQPAVAISTLPATVADAVAVTAVPTLVLVALPTVADAVAVADVPTTVLVALPNVNDAVAAADVPAVAVNLNVVASDLITTEEGVFANTVAITTRFAEAGDDPVVTDVAVVVVIANPPPVFVAEGRDPIGVCQPPGTGRNYPFVHPSADVADLFADFYLACEGFTPPFTLAYAVGFGSQETTPPPPGMPSVPVHAYDVVVTDALGRVAFDSTTATHYGSLDWADRLRVLEWTTDEAVCRAVIHTAWGLDDTPVEYEYCLTPGDGTLDPRTCNVLPGRVRTVRIAARALDGLTGTVRLRNGYNTTVVATPAIAGDGTRHVGAVTIAAVPGTGLGRKPGCATTPPIVRRINRVSPSEAGAFMIELDPCLRGQRPLAVTGADVDRVATYFASGLTQDEAAAALQYDSNCQPCCTCDDFVRTYRGLQVLYDQWRLVATTAEAVRDLYNDNRRRWLDQAAIRANQAVAVVAQMEGNCQAFIGGSYCNFSTCCLAPTETRYTFQLYRGGVEVAWPDSTVLVAIARDTATCGRDTAVVPDTVGPVVRFYHDALDPQRTAVSRFRVCVPCDAGDALKVTMTAHAADPPPPETGACDLTTATVPAAIQALWTDNSVTGATARGVATKLIPLDPNTPTPAPTC